MRELFHLRPELQKSASVGGVYELLLAHPENPDPRVFLPPVYDTVMYGTVEDPDRQALVDAIERGVKEAVSTLIVEFGSYGKAPKVEMASLDEMAERYEKAGI
jgi:fructose-bisphosphate aldolase class II